MKRVFLQTQREFDMCSDPSLLSRRQPLAAHPERVARLARAVGPGVRRLGSRIALGALVGGPRLRLAPRVRRIGGLDYRAEEHAVRRLFPGRTSGLRALRDPGDAAVPLLRELWNEVIAAPLEGRFAGDPLREFARRQHAYLRVTPAPRVAVPAQVVAGVRRPLLARLRVSAIRVGLAGPAAAAALVALTLFGDSLTDPMRPQTLEV